MSARWTRGAALMVTLLALSGFRPAPVLPAEPVAASTLVTSDLERQVLLAERSAAQVGDTTDLVTPVVLTYGGKDAQAARLVTQRANAERAIQVAREKRIEKEAKLAAEKKAKRWVKPVKDYQITATFGETSGLWSTTHTGLDFAGAQGSKIRAVAKGRVTFTGVDGAYGNKTVIKGDKGREFWYAHQSAIEVSVGEKVSAGEVIGSVGATGNVTGAHLHLEVRKAGTPLNPMKELKNHGLKP